MFTNNPAKIIIVIIIIIKLQIAKSLNYGPNSQIAEVRFFKKQNKE